MLPHANNGPARFGQSGIGIEIACSIAFKLCSPPFAVGFRPGAVLGAPVPETAIYEHGDLRSGEDDVGAPPRQYRVVDPISEATLVQLAP